MGKLCLAFSLVVFACACGKSADPASRAESVDDYAMKAKALEATEKLNQLGRLAKAYYAEQAKFPEGTAALTPAAKCCAGANQQCAVSDEWTKSALWHELDFQIEEPTRFQYSYTSTATGFIATAVGDLDCDGTSITYTLTGSVTDGNPSVALVKPDRLD